MKNPLGAFVLGLLSFLMLFLVGETFGLTAAYAVLAVYFITCQFLLSRGHLAAWRKDWRIMLALDTVPILIFLLTVLAETREVVLSQGLATLISCCGGTLIGAVVAAVEARRHPSAPVVVS